jgi:hypothetical protein
MTFVSRHALRAPRADRAALLALSAFGLAGCSGNDFESVSAVQGVRVLAVRPAAPPDANGNVPGSGFPGETLTLDMLYTDGRTPIPAPGEPESEALPSLAWLGGCHNPPSRLYYACAPILQAIAEGLVENGGAPEGIPPGIFGTESPFTLPIPDDILSRASVVPSDPIHFGVSYVFFGVCAGTLLPRPERTEGIPLDCVDASGKALGQRDFVVGFSTVYTYEGVTNLNPELPVLYFDGTPVTGSSCAEPGSCVVTVPACSQGEDCPAHRIAPEVSTTSFEFLPDGSHEILWASYYATKGEISKESQLVADRATGRVADFTSGWRAPGNPGMVRIWVTINDERGGAAWSSFDVLVE